MRVTKPLLAISFAAATVAACALPDRDNRNDPTIRPTAGLTLSNGPFSSGCDSASADSVNREFSRARCLYWSADASSDPQGESDISRYVYAFRRRSDGVVVSGDTSGNATAVWDPNRLRTFETGDYDALLTVYDRAGHFGTSATIVTLKNDPPVAVAPGPRRVVNWGAAWTTNGGIDYSTPPCDSVLTGGAFHYILRWLKPDGTLVPAAGQPGICAVPSYTALTGDDLPGFSRDLSGGEVCVAIRDNDLDGTGGPDLGGIRMVRFSPTGTIVLDTSLRAQLAGGNVTIADSAADPQQCWAVANLSGQGVIAVLGSDNRITFSGFPSPALPSMSTVAPAVGFQEVSNQRGARFAIVGGIDEMTAVQIDGFGPSRTINEVPSYLRFPAPFETRVLRP